MYNTAFDALYWLFGIVILLILLASLVRASAIARRGSPERRSAQACVAVGVGALLSLIAGFGFNALRPLTGDLLYQQAHFAAFYVGFGVVLWALDRVETLPGASGISWWRTIVWTAFGLSTVLAVVKLLTLTAIISGTGGLIYAQQAVFFLPIFVVLVAAVLELPRRMVFPGDMSTRRTALWLGALATCMVVGMLREATIIPSTDQPIVDLVLAFGPFTLGAACLYAAVPVKGKVRPDQAAVANAPAGP